MKVVNIEFKARVADRGQYEKMLLDLNPEFRGEDRQTDIYFVVPQGRLKLREGNIENALIYYERNETSGVRESDVILHKHEHCEALKKILNKLHQVKTVVKKNRRIYFIGNVKFHFDRIEGHGDFVEVEAIDETGSADKDDLRRQCLRYLSYFGIGEGDLVHCSYSDMLPEQN